MMGKPQVLPMLWLVFMALLGGVVLGFPLYLLAALLLASTFSTSAGMWPFALLVVALLVLAAWLLCRPALSWRVPGAALLGSLVGGGAWFSLFGLAGLV